MIDDDPEMLPCPFEDCDAGPWPATYGADGGKKKRFLHVLREHDDCRGNPLNRL